MVTDNQILLLSTKEIASKEEFIHVHAAFPLYERNIPHLIVKTLLQLSDSPYSEWENNQKILRNRYYEILSFIEGIKKEFVFENKKYFLLKFELDPPTEYCETIYHFTGKTPKVKVIFDKTYASPIQVKIDTERIDSLPYRVPVITRDSYPGLSLKWVMPFEIKNKKFYMFDDNGEYIGEPYEWAAPLDYNFYLVEKSLDNWVIINRDGIQITEDFIQVQEFNILWGFIFITKNDKWGFVSFKGEVCDPKFDEVKQLKDGSILGPVEVRIGNKWGYVTKSYEFITEEQLNDKKYDLFDYRDYWY